MPHLMNFYQNKQQNCKLFYILSLIIFHLLSFIRLNLWTSPKLCQIYCKCIYDKQSIKIVYDPKINSISQIHEKMFQIEVRNATFLIVLNWRILECLQQQQKTEMRKILKPSINSILPFSFSTLKLKTGYPLKMATSHSSHQGRQMTKDAAKVFQQFFKQNPPNQSQKSFFDMGFHDKEETLSFNPFKILGLEPTQNKQKIKEAYRQLAMKYHPKKNSSFEASEKFVQIALAYEMLSQDHKIAPKRKTSLSFMSEFNNKVQQYMNHEAGVNASHLTSSGQSHEKTAQLYSETTSIKRVGNKKQVKIEKEYNRNGNLMKITRVELYDENGTVQISETYDDSSDVIHKLTREEQTNDQTGPITKHINWKDNIFVASNNTYQMKDDKAKKDQKDKPKQKKQDKKDTPKQKKDNKEKKPKA